MIRGISVLNPVDVERDYFLYTIDYAIKNNINHIQLIGPIHNYVKGNIEGMTPYIKYQRYNKDKDTDYLNMCLDVVNEGCKKAKDAGIKMYFWHHELDLPDGFSKDYPEILNSDKDIEVTHPLVKDFLENKIKDFFTAYPYMDGLILTLHETKVPLLKLKNQKLGKVERVKYVTEILYNTCVSLGKELIVRPFASTEEDYTMMTKAYEEISGNLLIMDKWTQFDWSLCLPHNKFFNKIKSNPLFVETDIFGEYFGKGRLPIMLKDHILKKVEYCEGFKPAGYVNRIDRGGKHPFGDVNEVNLDIMVSCMNGTDTQKAIEDFFDRNYPDASKEVMELMENTEDIMKKIFHLKTYYFTELSIFPSVNHSKNHFYFEMMRDNYDIASNEWFIPIGWERGHLDAVLSEKAEASQEAEASLNKLFSVKDKIDEDKYKALWLKFTNLKYVAMVWEQMTHIFYNYTKYFETGDAKFEDGFLKATEKITYYRNCAVEELGNNFYCYNGDNLGDNTPKDYIGDFVTDVKKSFEIEKELMPRLEAEGLTDFIICGGATEGHRLMKEVNFSDTYIKDGKLLRIPGTNRGKGFSAINTHGWFSYELKVNKGVENKICLVLGTMDDSIDIKVNIDGEEHTISENTKEIKEFVITHIPKNDTVRIRFDRFTADTPAVYLIKVK